MDGKPAHAIGIVVGAVVELEAKANFGNRGRTHTGEVGARQLAAIDPHTAAEAAEDAAGVAPRGQHGEQDAEDDPHGTPRAVATARIVFLEKIGEQPVAENESVVVADPKAATTNNGWQGARTLARHQLGEQVLPFNADAERRR